MSIRGRAQLRSAIALTALVWVQGTRTLASQARERDARTEARPPALPEVIGERGIGLIVADDTLLDVAERNHVGFDALMRLNPGVDVWLPPSGMIPPRVAQQNSALSDARGIATRIGTLSRNPQASEGANP